MEINKKLSFWMILEHFGLFVIFRKKKWKIKGNKIKERVVSCLILSWFVDLIWRRAWCTGVFWVGLSGRVSGARCSEVRDLIQRALGRSPLSVSTGEGRWVMS